MEKLKSYDEYINEDFMLVFSIVGLSLLAANYIWERYKIIREHYRKKQETKKFEKLLEKEKDLEKRKKIIKYINALKPDLQKLALEFDKLKEDKKISEKDIEKLGYDLIKDSIEWEIDAQALKIFMPAMKKNIAFIKKELNLSKEALKEIEPEDYGKKHFASDYVEYYDEYLKNTFDYLKRNKLTKEEKIGDWADIYSDYQIINLIPTYEGDGDENLWYKIRHDSEFDKSDYIIKLEKDVKEDLLKMPFKKVLDKYVLKIM